MIEIERRIIHMTESYARKALYEDCYLKEEIKGTDFDDTLPDEFVSKTNVENAFNSIDEDLDSIEYDLNKIIGILEIDSIKKDVQELRKKLV